MIRKTRRLCLRTGRFFICMFTMLLLTGCTAKQPAESDSFRIAAVLSGNKKVRETSYWQQIWDGIYSEVDLSGIALSEYTTSEDTSIADRLTLAAAARPDAIIVSLPNSDNANLKLALQNARNQGIRITAIDTQTSSDMYDLFIGIDNQAIGRQMADYICSHAETDQSILVLSAAASGAVEARKTACLDILDAEDYAYTLLQLSEESEQRLEEIGKSLQNTPDTTWIVSFDPSSTIQAAETLLRMKQTEQITLIGFDDDTEKTAAYRAQGLQLVLVTQNVPELGREAVSLTKRLLDGETFPDKEIYLESPLTEYMENN